MRSIFRLLIEMAFSIGDSVVCNADKYPTKQKYKRLFERKLQVVLFRTVDIVSLIKAGCDEVNCEGT